MVVFISSSVGQSRGGRGGRGGGGGGVDRSQSWFHGSMLEDPWARLLNDTSYHHKMSDSMIPQVGDSLVERLADETTEETSPGTRPSVKNPNADQVERDSEI